MGEALQDPILPQMAPETEREIFHKIGSIPNDGDALMEALGEARTAEGGILRTQGCMKGSSQEKPTERDKDGKTPTRSRRTKARTKGRGSPGRMGDLERPLHRRGMARKGEQRLLSPGESLAS